MDLIQLENEFEYDRWATLRWIDYLGEDHPDLSVIRHMLGAHKIWLLRCQGVSVTERPEIVPSTETCNDLIDEWMKLLRGDRNDRIIEYQMMNGTPHQLPFSDLVRHILNHRTYHRGELRGLCKARSADDFPETDYYLFAFDKQK